MGIQVANNASSKLATTLEANAGFLTLEAGDGELFPAFKSGDYGIATILDTNGQMEIVRITGRYEDTLTIERAQEGTTACTFAIGSFVEMRFTAGMYAWCLSGSKVLTDLRVTASSVSEDAEAMAEFDFAAATMHFSIPRGRSVESSSIDSNGYLKFTFASDDDDDDDDDDDVVIPPYYQRIVAPASDGTSVVLNDMYLIQHGWDKESPVVIELPEGRLYYSETGTCVFDIDTPVQLMLINRAMIFGRGGDGGILGSDGGDGTDAIYVRSTSKKVTLYNFGIIGAGAGGGGSGGDGSEGSDYIGGPGGGGSGYPSGKGGDVALHYAYNPAKKAGNGSLSTQSGGRGGDGGEAGSSIYAAVTVGAVGIGGDVYEVAGTSGERNTFIGTGAFLGSGSGGAGGAIGASGGDGADGFGGKGGSSGASIRGALNVTVALGEERIYGPVVDYAILPTFYQPPTDLPSPVEAPEGWVPSNPV